MSDVCHNLLGLHTNVKQDTVTARREGERVKKVEIWDFPGYLSWGHSSFKGIFCNQHRTEEKFLPEQQKHFTKCSEHFTIPALRAFFPHQYFEDILQLCSQAEIISGCDMTPVLLSLSAFLTSYWLPAPVLFRILSVNWLGIIFVGHPGLAPPPPTPRPCDELTWYLNIRMSSILICTHQSDTPLSPVLCYISC